MSIHIKLTKLARLPDRPNGDSPIGEMTEGYTVWGHCIDMPKCGEVFNMTRYKRNDVLAYGLFNTSVIQEVHYGLNKPTLLVTENSVYELEVINVEVSIRNKPLFKPVMNKEIYMDTLSSMYLAAYAVLEAEGYTFASVEEDDAFHDTMMLFLEETFNWPDYASYN
jgi:hypothetical protein